jgi:hypothetical protein
MAHWRPEETISGYPYTPLHNQTDATSPENRATRPIRSHQKIQKKTLAEPKKDMRKTSQLGQGNNSAKGHTNGGWRHRPVPWPR